MKLHEFAGKSTPRGYGIYVQKSFPVREEQNTKSHVLTGSRMKNGGVLFADTP
ncbi:MAG: hypothetical protein ACP5UP_07415 [Athalassotoga sp.]|uniref:hypothetical protein n=1 Tax=Athalassotoga sp. TaxID=2022597 RepID=UPI003D03DFEE